MNKSEPEKFSNVELKREIIKNKVLLIDNFDSFTYNLSHCLEISGFNVTILRNNNRALFDVISKVSHIVISPGPSTPQNSGFSKEIVSRFYKEKRILGICLGMQAINEVLGGDTIKAPFPVHGKINRIAIDNSSNLFRDMPALIKAARYHSLICSNICSQLAVTSEHDNIPMAFEHKNYPLYGIQFHPESFLTEYGLKIISNFFRI